MDLVILHYHLNRGGVARVIENHLRAIAQASLDTRPSRVVVAYGGRAIHWNGDFADQLPFPVEFAVLPALDYDSHRTDAEDLRASLCRFLEEKECSSDETVLHVHNHSLGKNCELPETLLK